MSGDPLAARQSTNRPQTSPKTGKALLRLSKISAQHPFLQLDGINNPGLSKEDVRDAKVRERKRRKAKKARKKGRDVDTDVDD